MQYEAWQWRAGEIAFVDYAHPLNKCDGFVISDGGGQIAPLLLVSTLISFLHVDPRSLKLAAASPGHSPRSLAHSSPLSHQHLIHVGQDLRTLGLFDFK